MKTKTKTPYDVLGVPRRADDETIRAALRRAAKMYHPDVNVADPAAEQRLKEVIAAYGMLKSPQQRAAYDRHLRYRGRQNARRFVRTALASAGLVSAVALALVVRLSNPKKAAAPVPEPSVAVVETVKPEIQRVAALEPDRGLRPEGVVDRESDREPAAPKTPLTGEWEQMASSGHPMAIWAFAARNAETPEAELARSWLMLLIEATEDTSLLNFLRFNASGTVAERAEQRLAHLGHSRAIVKADTVKPIAANDGELKDIARSKDPAFYLERGLRRFRELDLDRAIADFDEAIRLDPDNAPAHGQRANAWGSKGDLDRALADFAVAIRIDPNSATIVRDRGILLRRSGALDRALVDFDQAIRLGFSDAAAYNERGQVWLAKGHHERAIADFNQAIKNDPNLAGAYVNRAIALRNKGDLDRAIVDFNQAVSIDPSIALAHPHIPQGGK